MVVALMDNKTSYSLCRYNAIKWTMQKPKWVENSIIIQNFLSCFVRVYGLARKTLQMVHSPGLAAPHSTIWSISTKINNIHPIQKIIQDSNQILHHLFCRAVKFPPKMDGINPKWIIIQNIKQSCSMLVITRVNVH